MTEIKLCHDDRTCRNIDAIEELTARAEFATALLQTNIEQSNAEIAALRAEIARLQEAAAGLAGAAQANIEALHFAILEIELGAPYEFSEEWWYKIDKRHGNASAWNYKRFCDALAAIQAALTAYDAAAGKGGKR